MSYFPDAAIGLIGATGPAVPVNAEFMGFQGATGTFQGVSFQNPLPISMTGPAGNVSITGTVGVTQSTSPWVISQGTTGPVNVAQFGGNNVVTGTGVGGAGIPRVTVSNDSVVGLTGSTSAIGTVGQGAPASIVNSWTVEITNGATGPAAVKGASVAALATDAALVVTTNGSTTANVPAQTSVTKSSSSILSANTARRECTVANTGTVSIYLGLGQVPTTTAYHIPLAVCGSANDGTGGTYTSDLWKGAINAIGATGGATCVVTELT